MCVCTSALVKNNRSVFDPRCKQGFESLKLKCLSADVKNLDKITLQGRHRNLVFSLISLLHVIAGVLNNLTTHIKQCLQTFFCFVAAWRVSVAGCSILTNSACSYRCLSLFPALNYNFKKHAESCLVLCYESFKGNLRPLVCVCVCVSQYKKQ